MHIIIEKYCGRCLQLKRPLAKPLLLVIKAWGKLQDSLLISTAFSILQTTDFYVKRIEFLRYSMLFTVIISFFMIFRFSLILSFLTAIFPLFSLFFGSPFLCFSPILHHANFLMLYKPNCGRIIRLLAIGLLRQHV